MVRGRLGQVATIIRHLGGKWASTGAGWSQSQGTDAGQRDMAHGKISNYMSLREMCSLRSLELSVVRFKPSLAAAPAGPPITPFVVRRTRRIWSRSAASRVA